jgi:threonylcarbamoyladenosine tRNA methylthiotransferase MtaB
MATRWSAVAGSAERGPRGEARGEGAGRSRVALVALGCRVNRAELDALAAELGESFAVAREGEAADFVVVNTCTITADAGSAARRTIRRAAREHPGARVVAAGCHAEISPGELAALPGVAAVVGARRQGTLAAVLGALRAGVPAEVPDRSAEEDASWGAMPEAPARHTRPFLKVQDGCDRRCSYCVVPLARGPSRSLPFDEALRRLALLGARHPEVVLTGVHLGAYGRELSPRRSLAELVAAAVRARSVLRLRLSSVEPDELPLELLDSRETAAGLCEHLHLPLQSGSARVLAAMRRPYGPGRFREVVEAVAARLPGACLGTDVLAGFPGETERDHRATVALVESLPLAYLHVFPFSPRPGTPAAELPGRIAAEAVRERARELLAVSERKWRGFLASRIGRELEVVVERIDGGVARGTAREWLPARWPAEGELRGSVARVRVAASDGAACLCVRTGRADPPNEIPEVRR